MKKNILIILLAFLLYNCSSNKKHNFELANFNGGNVSQSEYIEHYLLSTKFKPKKLPTEENLKEIVHRKALEKMAVLEAKEKKIDTDSLYQNIIQSNERRLLSQKYVQTKLIPKVITDSLINKFYKEFSPQYRMKYIMRPFLKESSISFIDSQKKKIKDAYKMLKNGVKFKKVVEKYSQDITTNKKGGDLGWIIRESMGDVELRKTFDTLSQYSYSKPFKGYGGYYILYKGAKRDVKIPPFKTIKSQIWKTLYHSRKAYVEKAIDEEFAKLSKKYNYIQYNSTVEKLLKKYFGNDKRKLESASLDFDKFSEQDLSTIIAKYNGGIIRVKDLFTDRKRSPTNKQEFIKRLVNIAQQHLFTKYAKEIKLQNEPELKDQLEQMKNSLLRTILYKKMVKDKLEKQVSMLSNLNTAVKVKRKRQLENSLRKEFEHSLETKYSLKFNTENFDTALKIALKKKKLQNAENKK